MSSSRYTVDTLHETFPDDDVCLDYIFQQKYGGLDACPKCGVAEPKYYRVRSRKCYECKDCGYQISPLAGTIFHKSDTGLKKWFFAMYMFSVSRNGVSAKELERTLGVTYKTAWRMCKQIRLLMQQDGSKLSGIVEADETYIGGVEKDGRSVRNKTPVLGVVEKGGQAKAFVSDYATRSRAMSFVRANVEVGAELHTDESRIYYWTKHEYEHKSVNHSRKEYARDKVHTNTIEGFWGQLKRSIDGTYHCVSPKYLQYYVNEFVFRYNFRTVPIFPYLLAMASQRVQ